MQRPLVIFIHASVMLVFACGGGSTPAASPEPVPAPAAHSGAGHHGHHPDFPVCAVLAKTCHGRDSDSDNAHACHILGHSAQTNEECEAKRVECLAICSADGGT